ncbi:39S ribosomal protein L47, mitochondrial [Uranotaenia lowii]|uniref:39S ribosomal protein L47, mitochondrial n=1 Tax=Uranotaenia lowii TaxID=190385 RepID=UPI002479CDDF|nr:39S ribosomal protein L47, mitochondrial [Uranotaenia lowii]
MSLFTRIFQTSRCLGKLTLTSGSQGILHFSANRLPARVLDVPCRSFSKTEHRYDLMEFFDDKKNWGENEIKHGRSWKKDELRIKSNTDLHKLWFVLLKERNMLLTMEHECNEKMELFPNPERIDKVNESMKNLEDVVRERNRAYYELETGETGERPGEVVENQLGLRFYYKMFEHVIPKFANKAWNEKHNFSYRGSAVRKFLKLYREKLYNVKRKQRNRDRNEVMSLLKRFPNMDRIAIAEKYPSVDVDKLMKQNKIRGNCDPLKV